MPQLIKKPIERLKATRWWKPTVRRYGEHVLAIKRLDCLELREPFIVFAIEVLNAPEDIRDNLLAQAPLEPQEPQVRYPQYEQPRADQMKIGVDRGCDTREGWERKKSKRS